MNHTDVEKINPDSVKKSLARFSFRHARIFRRDIKETDPESIIAGLEKKCYVSCKERSLFEYLVKGPECPEERNYPLGRRIRTK